MKSLTILIGIQFAPQPPAAHDTLREMHNEFAQCSAYYDMKEKYLRAEGNHPIREVIATLGLSIQATDRAARIAAMIPVDPDIFRLIWTETVQEIKETHFQDSYVRFELRCAALMENPKQVFWDRYSARRN